MKHLDRQQLLVLFSTWLSARERTGNPEASGFEHYGARGITMCERWASSFDAFVADMGARPDGFSLDRIDVNGAYSPANCRWASAHVQARNRRDTKITPEDYLDVMRFVAEGVPTRAIGALYGVTPGAITMIMSRAGVKSVCAPRGKVGRAVVDDIRRRYAAGESVASIAKTVPLKLRAVYDVVSGHTWKD